SATHSDWAGKGIRLNAVAPGATLTPLLQGGLDHPTLGAAIRGFPIPLGGFGTPDQVAAAIAFLLGPASTFCCGTILFADGGSDALLRPDALCLSPPARLPRRLRRPRHDTRPRQLRRMLAPRTETKSRFGSRTRVSRRRDRGSTAARRRSIRRR